MRSRLLCALLAASHLVAASLAAQDCPGGRIRAGDLGIRGLRCAGPAASCAINVRSGDADSVRHIFAVEPVIATVDSASTSIRAGDTLVAIDGILITTAAGGGRLAQLRIGQAIVLLIRRDGALLDLRLTARAGCGVTSLKVSR